jgi:Rrf2 family transcriptional regulator, nitric oxide-sensitive transcriptional repressor
MRLTQWTDYTLRVLMYCAQHQGRENPITITEIAEHHGISRSHLTKIVQELAAQSLLDTTRGRGGGMRLARPANNIQLGTVVRATERDFTMVECFDPAQNQCCLDPRCGLKGVISRAMQAYFEVLDGVTLAELVTQPRNTVALPRSRKSPGNAIPD